MSLVSVVFALLVIGVLLYLINTYVPMAPTIKKLLNIVVVLAVVLWLLYAFGVLGSIESVRMPRWHR